MSYITMRRRWSDNDRYFGPFTYSRDRRRPMSWAIVLSSGEEEYLGAQIRFTGFGHTFICAVPRWLIRPYREKITAHWDGATIARMGRDWYWSVDQREFGFSYSEGFLMFFRGRRTMDSRTDRTKGYFLPWTQWRLVRHSLYGLNGEFHAHMPDTGKRWPREDGAWQTRWELQKKIESSCPTAAFLFDDFDGERITATTKIEEREWLFGTGWFKWLSLFRRPMVKRSLDISFSAETGKRKGSWKGGTIGHSIEMLPNELHESAFRRYCAEHDMTFIGTA